MANPIRNFLTAPIYEGEPEKTQDAGTTHRVGIALLGLAVFSIFFIVRLAPPIREFALGATGGGVFVWLFTIYLVKREQLTAAKVIIVAVNTFNLYTVMYATGGFNQPTVFTLLFLLALANLLFPRRGAIVYGVILLVLASILYTLGLVGVAPQAPPPDNALPAFLNFIFTLVAVAAMLAIASGNFQRNLETVRENENELRERNAELDLLKGDLEQRVTDRTNQLETRASQFEAIAKVARSIASLQNLDELLASIARLVIENFGFYHTGIFLIDESREYAILVASPTEAGRQMIANGHRMRVGELSIVGRVAASGEPRVTLDTGMDAVHFNNPFLPNTHSEMALPLKAEGRIIGVLDVQSDKPQAFNEEDVASMQILADLMATAIERTRLLQQVESNLRELERTYGQTTTAGWKSLSESGLIGNTGYRFDNVRIQPIADVPSLGYESMQKGNAVKSNADTGSSGLVAIPIKIRGQSIGVITVKLKEGANPVAIGTIEQAIDRLAGSLESARLFEEARSRANREQAISQVTTAISSATDFDSILRTTAEEIGKSLGNSEVSIQIVSDSDKLT